MNESVRYRGEGPNWTGFKALYLREIHRFFRVFVQTIATPVIMAVLFHMVFSIAFSGEGRSVADVPFTEFLVPGLVMMSMLMGSYQGSSISITMAKVLNNIVDTLMSPMTALELTASYVLAGTTRGLITGFAVGIALFAIAPVDVHNVALILFHAAGAAMALSLIGMIGSIWAERIDNIAAVTNFVIMPLSFLSGTFYSVEALPEFAQTIARFNPVFYMIDGFRYGFIGHADAPLWIGIIVVVGINALLWAVCHRMFLTGYRLKA